MSVKIAMGIDIGGTAIKHGLFSLQGEIILQDSTTTPSRAPKKEILDKILWIIQQDLQYAKKHDLQIPVIGIGTPGSVDIRRGFLMGSTPNFTHWRDVPIGEYLTEKSGIPVFVDNDANLMAYGEFIFGAGKGRRNVICITLGTGIGGGVIVEGELYRGHYFAGAELGHITIDFDGRKCKCGGTGCLERYASATALIKDYNDKNQSEPVEGTKQIFQRLNKGDGTARQVLDQYIHYLGAGLSSFVNIFNPERIVIGGGVSEAGERFIRKIEKATRERAMPASMNHVEIVSAHLGNRAGMLGAAAYALNMLDKKQEIF